MNNLEFRRGLLRFVGGNPKSQIPNPKDKNVVFGIWDFGTCPNPKSQSWDLAFVFLGKGAAELELALMAYPEPIGRVRGRSLNLFFDCLAGDPNNS